jgi:hypothetical protein
VPARYSPHRRANQYADVHRHAIFNADRNAHEHVYQYANTHHHGQPNTPPPRPAQHPQTRRPTRRHPRRRPQRLRSCRLKLPSRPRSNRDQTPVCASILSWAGTWRARVCTSCGKSAGASYSAGSPPPAGKTAAGWTALTFSHSSVYVEVFFYPGDGRVIKMEIVNPAPGTEYGWLSRGMCHAIEVAWPD